MKVAVNAVISATQLQLHGERRTGGDGKTTSSGTLDSDIYLGEQSRSYLLHRRTPDGKVFALAVQLYSDSALVSWSGGK